MTFVRKLRERVRNMRPLSLVALALLASLVVAGGATAAATITGSDVVNNSLTGRDIRGIKGGDVTNNSLTGADIKNIRSGDIRDGTLLAKDFKPGELPSGGAGAQGTSGAQGPPGPQGAQGPAGASAAGGTLVSWSTSLDDDQRVVVAATPNGQLRLWANCDDDDSGDGTQYQLENNGPNNGVAQSSDSGGWVSDFDNSDTVTTDGPSDGAVAMLTNGTSMQLPEYGGLIGDTGEGFSQDSSDFGQAECLFSGHVAFTDGYK